MHSRVSLVEFVEGMVNIISSKMVNEKGNEDHEVLELDDSVTHRQ